MMTRSIRTALFAGAVGFASCAGPDENATADIDLEAARAEVLAAEDAMNQAVDGIDCATGMTYAAESEPLFVSGGNVVRTKSELSAVCERMVAPRSGAVFSIDARSARMLSDAAAVVVREGNYTINFLDGTSLQIYLVMSTVWEHDVDGWRMIHLHESTRPPAG